MTEFDGNTLIKSLPSDVIIKILELVPKQLLMKIKDAPAISEHALEVAYKTVSIINSYSISQPIEYFRMSEVIQQSARIPYVDDDSSFTPAFLTTDHFAEFCEKYTSFKPKKLVFESVEDFIRLHNSSPDVLQGIQSFTIAIPWYFTESLDQLLGVDNGSADDRAHSLNALVASMPYNIEHLSRYPVGPEGLVVPDSVRDLEVFALQRNNVDLTPLSELPLLTRLKLCDVKLDVDDLKYLPSRIEKLELSNSLSFKDCSDPQFPQSLTDLEISLFAYASTTSGSEEVTDFHFDLSHMINLKNLKVTRVEVNSLDSLVLPKLLSSLTILESESLTNLRSLKSYQLENLVVTNMRKLDVTSILSKEVLPVSLKTLTVGQRDRVKPDHGDLEAPRTPIGKDAYLPPNLTKFRLQGKWLEVTDELNLPFALESLTIFDSAMGNLKALVSDLHELKELVLMNVIKFGGIEKTSFPASLQKLILRKCGIQEFYDTNIKQLTSLRRLELQASNFDFGELPTSLEYVKLLRSVRRRRDDPEPRKMAYPSVELPNLKELSFVPTFDIPKVSFPTLKRLSVPYHVFDDPLDQICPNLEMLTMEVFDPESLVSCKNMKHLTTIMTYSGGNFSRLPKGREKVYTEFFLPKSLEELNLLFGHGTFEGDFIDKLKLDKLPNLQIIKFGKHTLTQIKSDQLPNNLVELSLTQNNLKQIDLKNSSSLRILKLYENRLNEFEEGHVSLPNSLEILDVSSVRYYGYLKRKAEHFPVGNCKKLKVLFGKEHLGERCFKIETANRDQKRKKRRLKPRVFHFKYYLPDVGGFQ